MAQAAMRFILDNPGITTVLGGFSDIAQMEEACLAVDQPALDADEVARIADVWRGA